jgi:hypothetical protein
VSASRRTDVPRFHGDWFAARRRAGVCESRSVFGRRSRVSLRREDVLGYLFWSKDTTPFEGELRSLLDEAIPVALQFTLNGYGPAVEGRIPPPGETIPAFLRAAAMLPAPEAIEWRYDPLVVTERLDAAWHRANFRRIAATLEGRTRVCNTSVVEPYPQAVRRMGEAVAYRPPEPGRHARVRERHPALRRAGEEVRELAAELAAIAREHGIGLRACCDPWLASGAALPGAACCSAALFAPYGIDAVLSALPSGASRPGCRCLRAVDIGMDETCPGGCAYCYVTRSAEAAARHHAARDPAAPSLRP